jgi:hypothetical protein
MISIKLVNSEAIPNNVRSIPFAQDARASQPLPVNP